MSEKRRPVSERLEEEYERGYGQGRRQAGIRLLRTALELLDVREYTKERALVERLEAIVELREVCAEYGDNDWEDDLHLADIIEKHLHRHLAEREGVSV